MGCPAGQTPTFAGFGGNASGTAQMMDRKGAMKRACRQGSQRTAKIWGGRSQGSEIPLNNNRNNNRRRGRNNNRGGGNPMQGNRIDSRARGNAPQLLDKYKKLANDAAMNDDRVQTEYYLQFADHYFRVIADNKAQKEEAQAKRNSERGDNQSDDDDGDDNEQQGRKPRARKNDREPKRSRRGDEGQQQGSEGDSGDQQDGDNPFVAEKPKARKPRKKKDDAETSATDDGGLDPSMLPPSIARADAGDADAQAEKPKKGLRPRRKPREDGDSGATEAA